MQAAPLGEYAARLRLLASFQGQLAALAAQAKAQAQDSQQGGRPGAQEGGQQGGQQPAQGELAAQAARWAALSALLYNVHRYYAQFAPHVERQLGTGLHGLEKELQVGGNRTRWRGHRGGTLYLLAICG